MEIIEFNQELHRGVVNKWLAKRGHPPVLDFPAIGYCIQLHNNALVCCGFLRKIEGGYAMIDGYASDPEALPVVRHDALNLLTAQLVKEAQRLEIKTLFALSIDKNTIMRASDHGFSVLPYAALALDTSKKAD